MAQTPQERSKAYRDRQRGAPPRLPTPCGTYPAYRRHQRNNETPCGLCRDAYNDYMRALRVNSAGLVFGSRS